ncbi:uncharacterized protein GGS25DRAFT_517262 [Hypoxylon fragiforme]|uniref:uncharacterized protein n=1 Tax=Hypoxylon fragiforme TaxID=63214 RepID=UPI0020C72856|nr:uncharacterized protein GGS25DRAFT_517262 [Hypoxylon fragiforme]KAI2614415.1 hypothetical protein GGS25DRAFT_517262 [Hypoxylon fragiforme]
MSTISRLPDSTTRLLSSSLVIPTPVSLIKELIDNSIDAQATSIEVIVSPDTIKKVEVRDNGHGIHPDDYDALGKRGYTSKIRNFEELKTHSSKTLGFRGEALASANAFAQVAITTKIASEPVGTIIHLVPCKGGISTQQRTSAPVGTTLSITNLFSKHPVRERIAIKDSPKTIGKIQGLLRSYAMARPQLRLSFKVLQSPKHNWVYSPKRAANMREAAIQLFGAEIATHCFEKVFESGPVGESESLDEVQVTPPNDHYIFEAFILKPGSDASKVPKRRYFSVNGRPIRGTRDTMKKLVGIYAEYVSASQRHSSNIVSRDSFISLNIKCPPGSYDENVEPSKDDVVFSDEKLILDGFDNLCKAVYKTPMVNPPEFESPAKQNSISYNRDDANPRDLQSHRPTFDSISGDDSIACTLPSQGQVVSQPRPLTETQKQQVSKVHQSPPTQPQTTIQCSTDHSATISTPARSSRLSIRKNGKPGDGYPQDMPSNMQQVRWKVDMSQDFNEHYTEKTSKSVSRSARALLDLHENPVPPEHTTSRDMNPWVIAKMNSLQTNHSLGDRQANELYNQNNLFEPHFELPMTPDPPILRHNGASPRDLDVPPSQQYPGNSHQPRHRVPGGPYRSPMSDSSGAGSKKGLAAPSMATNLKPPRRYNLPWSPPSSVERSRPNNENLTNNEPGQTLDGMRQSKITFKSNKGSSKKRRHNENDDESVEEITHREEPRLGNNLENMVALAKQSLKHQVSQQKGLSSSHPEAHYIEAHSTEVKEPIKTTIPSGDPRAYLLRRQKSMAAGERGAQQRKIRRMKSSLLPLENIPSNYQTHSVMLIKSVDIQAMYTLVEKKALYDDYIAKGTLENGLEMSLDIGREIEKRLKALLRTEKDPLNNQEVEPEINLCSQLKGKMTAA